MQNGSISVILHSSFFILYSSFPDLRTRKDPRHFRDGGPWVLRRPPRAISRRGKAHAFPTGSGSSVNGPAIDSFQSRPAAELFSSAARGL